MTIPISDDQALKRLFQSTLERAFEEFKEIYAPGVATHLAEDVLCDFIHVDRIYRLKNASGHRLEDLPDMLQTTVRKEGPERRLEVDSYIGDFTLFMGGFFPLSVHERRWFAPGPMVSKVGKILVSFHEPLEYFAAEGRNAYGRAAETARVFSPDDRETFSLLSEHFHRYTELLRRVKELISDDPQVRRAEESLD